MCKQCGGTGQRRQLRLIPNTAFWNVDATRRPHGDSCMNSSSCLLHGCCWGAHRASLAIAVDPFREPTFTSVRVTITEYCKHGGQVFIEPQHLQSTITTFHTALFEVFVISFILYYPSYADDNPTFFLTAFKPPFIFFIKNRILKDILKPHFQFK